MKAHIRQGRKEMYVLESKYSLFESVYQLRHPSPRPTNRVGLQTLVHFDHPIRRFYRPKYSVVVVNVLAQSTTRSCGERVPNIPYYQVTLLIRKRRILRGGECKGGWATPGQLDPIGQLPPYIALWQHYLQMRTA